MKKMINKKNIYLLLLLVISLFSISLGTTYAKFPSSYITQNDVVGLSLDFDIGIANIEEYEELTIPSGESETFNVDITNSSGKTLHYGIWYKVATPGIKNEDISMGITSGNVSGTLNNGANTTANIIIINNSSSRVTINIGVSTSESSTNDIEYLNGKYLIKNSLNFMKGFSGAYDSSYFHDATYKEKIKNVAFVDYIDTTSAVTTWDMSEKQDGSIMAWVTNNATSGYYDLYIGSKQMIFAKDLQGFFTDMKAIDSISFTNLDTSLTTNMYYMFRNTGYNSTVFTLDLGSNFNTSNVTNMNSMFGETGYNSPVFTLDLGSNFDTSKVTNMGTMFYMTGSNSTVFNLNLGDKFDTSLVTDMYGMFYMAGYNNMNFTLTLGNKFYTPNVTKMDMMFLSTGQKNPNLQLDLSTFTFEKVTSSSGMFSGFSIAGKIYVKDSAAQDWIIKNGGNANLTTSNVIIKS